MKKEEDLESETIKRRLKNRKELARTAFAFTSIGKEVAKEENIFLDCENEFRLLDAATGPCEEVGTTETSEEKNKKGGAV